MVGLKSLLNLWICHFVDQLCQVLHAHLRNRPCCLFPIFWWFLSVLDNDVAVDLIDLDWVREVCLLVNNDFVFELARIDCPFGLLLRWQVLEVNQIDVFFLFGSVWWVAVGSQIRTFLWLLHTAECVADSWFNPTGLIGVLLGHDWPKACSRLWHVLLGRVFGPLNKTVIHVIPWHTLLQELLVVLCTAVDDGGRDVWHVLV